MNKTVRPQPLKGSNRRRRITDHDFLWKGFLQFFLRFFILLVKPGLYRAIDWSRSPEFLEQEMRNALRRFTKRKKFTDLLVKVWLKSGEEKWILILVEVQSYFDSLFCERVFDYFNLLVNKYQMKDIAIFALYTGEHVPRVFDRFEHEIFGTSFQLKFTAVRATKQKEEALLKSKNPVALAFLTNIWRIRTKDKPLEREEKMNRLAEILRERKYDFDQFYECCTFVTDILNLSKNLENQFTMKATPTLKRRKPEQTLPLVASKSFSNAIFKAYYGWSPAELKKEMKKLEKQVEQKAQQAKQEVLQSKQEAQQAKRSLKKSILVLSKDLGWDAAKIAAHLEVEVGEVEKILAPKKSKAAA